MLKFSKASASKTYNKDREYSLDIFVEVIVDSDFLKSVIDAWHVHDVDFLRENLKLCLFNKALLYRYCDLKLFFLRILLSIFFSLFLLVSLDGLLKIL